MMSENAFYKKFIEEANTLLPKLEKTPSEKELLKSLFRSVHTIKGTSGMYGFDNILEFTHILENIYQSLRDRKLTLMAKFQKYLSNLKIIFEDS